VAGPVEHNNRKVFDVAIKPSSYRFQILRNRSIQIQRSTASRTGNDLLHITVRCVQQSAWLRDSKHCDGVGCASRTEIRTLERVHGNVDDAGGTILFESFGPDAFADIKHWSLVALAFTDDNPAVDRNLVESLSHRLHGCPV
jgi:hypothetical protein